MEPVRVVLVHGTYHVRIIIFPPSPKSIEPWASGPIVTRATVAPFLTTTSLTGVMHVTSHNLHSSSLLENQKVRSKPGSQFTAHPLFDSGRIHTWRYPLTQGNKEQPTPKPRLPIVPPPILSTYLHQPGSPSVTSRNSATSESRKCARIPICAVVPTLPTRHVPLVVRLAKLPHQLITQNA